MPTNSRKSNSCKPDTSAAGVLAFLAQGGPIMLNSYANNRNERRKFPPIERVILDPAEVTASLKVTDVPGRSSYFAVAEMVGDERNKESVAAIRALHADLDFKGIAEPEKKIRAVIKGLKVKPSIVVHSGNGHHLYWAFSEPLDPSQAPSCESLMRRICDRLAGDLSVAQVASVLRLPDSHNSKGGDSKLVKVLPELSSWQRYTYAEIDEYFEMVEREPLLTRVAPKRETSDKPRNSHQDFGQRKRQATSNFDLDEVLANMEYHGTEENGLDDTYTRVCGWLVRTGGTPEQAIDILLEPARAAYDRGRKPGEYKFSEIRARQEIRGKFRNWERKDAEKASDDDGTDDGKPAKKRKKKLESAEPPPSPLIYYRDAIADDRSKQWLIKNVAALMETSSWVGPPKSGKSAFLVDMCIAIASGRDWRGYTLKKQAGVIYFALERGDLTKRRLKGYAKRDKIADIPFAIRKGIQDLMAEECVDRIVDTINEAAEHFGCEVGMIVIDTFSKGIAAGGGEENSARDQNAVSANLRKVQERTGVHIATVGHTGKDESRGARGSNAHLGDVDVMAQFSTEQGDVVAVEVTGANDQPEGPLTRFKLQAINIGHDEDGEVITTHIVDEEEHGKFAVEKRLPPQKQLALDILHRVMKERGTKTKIGDHYHHMLAIDTWKDACKGAALSSGDDKSFERVFRDCLNKLREWKRLEVIDGKVRLLSYAGAPPDEDHPPTRNGKTLNFMQLFGLRKKLSKVAEMRITQLDPHPPADHVV